MMDTRFAALQTSDCHAVIFTSLRTPQDNGYNATADRMVELAQRQPGFLGIESARGADGFGITVSYWESEAAIRNWKQQAEHLEAQQNGQRTWYEQYVVRIAKLERCYAGK